MMRGIDISHWQDGINLAVVPCDFVILKATQGTRFVDPCFHKFYTRAKAAGKKLGVYHYYSSGEPEEQAEHFLKTVRGCIGEAILVLDWETDQNPSFRKGPALPKRFLDYIYEKTGVRPLIYMSKSVCREYDWTGVVSSNYGLWMAQYANKKPTGYQDKPWTDSKGLGAFKNYAIHQYTSNGRLDGYNGSLDLDVAYMTPEAWDKYARARNAPSSTSTPAKPAASTSSTKVESAKSKDAAIAGKYKTTGNLYLRVGAGTGKTAITLMPKGSDVQCYGYYTSYNGTRWYYVAYGNLTGFCSSAYLQRA